MHHTLNERASRARRTRVASRGGFDALFHFLFAQETLFFLSGSVVCFRFFAGRKKKTKPCSPAGAERGGECGRRRAPLPSRYGTSRTTTSVRGVAPPDSPCAPVCASVVGGGKGGGGWKNKKGERKRGKRGAGGKVLLGFPSFLFFAMK